MYDPKLYRDNPRDYAAQWLDNSDPERFALLLLAWLSSDDVREFLDAHEMSPRFDEGETEGEG